MKGINTSEHSEDDDVVFIIEGADIPASVLFATSFAHRSIVDAGRVVLYVTKDRAQQIRNMLGAAFADPSPSLPKARRSRRALLHLAPQGDDPDTWDRFLRDEGMGPIEKGGRVFYDRAKQAAVRRASQEIKAGIGQRARKDSAE